MQVACTSNVWLTTDGTSSGFTHFVDSIVRHNNIKFLGITSCGIKSGIKSFETGGDRVRLRYTSTDCAKEYPSSGHNRLIFVDCDVDNKAEISLRIKLERHIMSKQISGTNGLVKIFDHTMFDLTFCVTI